MEPTLETLGERLDAIRQALSVSNVMGYSGESIAPDRKTRALLELVDVLGAVVTHLQSEETAD